MLTAREIVEWGGLLIAIGSGVWALRKASREEVGMSDTSARDLRNDLSAADKTIKALRHQRRKLVEWITSHMWTDHNERFDPWALFNGEHDETDPGHD